MLLLLLLLQTEPSAEAAAGSSSIFSMFNWMSKPEKTGEEPAAAATSAATGGADSSVPIPIGGADSQQHGRHQVDMGEGGGLAYSNNSGSSDSNCDSRRGSAAAGRSLQGERDEPQDDLSTFRSIVEEQNQGQHTGQEQQQHHSLPPPPPPPPLPVRVETIVLPQLLEAILKVLENEPRPERVQAAVWSIEQALCPPPTSTATSGGSHGHGHGHLPPLRAQGDEQAGGAGGARVDTAEREKEREEAEAAALGTLSHNMEALTGEKSPEWLLWIYNCLLAFKRRDAQELLHDGGGFFSMSEGGSGVESGDDLQELDMDDSQHFSVGSNKPRPRPRPRPTASSPLSVQQQHLPLRADSLFQLAAGSGAGRYAHRHGAQAVLITQAVRHPEASSPRSQGATACHPAGPPAVRQLLSAVHPRLQHLHESLEKPQRISRESIDEMRDFS